MTEGNLPVPAADSRMSFGQTRLDAGDIVMPRIKILQSQSAEATGDDALGTPGEFFNTLTNVVYGKTLRFVPILPFKQRVLLVRSEREASINASLVAAGLEVLPSGSSGLVCRSFDMDTGTGSPGIACGTCPLSQWDESDPPLCTETYNVAAASETGELIVLSFAKSSAKTGKQLFSMIRMMPGAAGTVFEATTRAERNDKGNFFVPLIRPAEPAPPELLRQVRTWASQLEGVRLDVTPDEDVEVPPAGASGDPF